MDLKLLEHLPILKESNWLFGSGDRDPVESLVEIVEVETIAEIPLLGDGILGPELHLVYVIGLLPPGKKAKYKGEIESDDCEEHRLLCCQEASRSGNVYLPSARPINLKLSRLTGYHIIKKITDGQMFE